MGATVGRGESTGREEDGKKETAKEMRREGTRRSRERMK
jgi:hypothetical protein